MGKVKMVVTGAGGFLSARLYEYYKHHYDITPLTRKELDITNHSGAKKMIEELHPDIIVHAAAISATQACEWNPDLANRVNVDASINIGRTAEKIGAKMLFISSEQVFNGNINEGPYKEDDHAVPSTKYGETKLEAEKLLKNEIEALWILRLSWMFGLPERNVPNNPNLFWNVVRAALLNQPIKISTNEYRGVTHVYDLLDQLKDIFELPFGTYHFGSKNEESTYDTAIFILQQLGVPKEVIHRVILRDDEKHKLKKRDLRMSYDKIQDQNIHINTSQESIAKGIKDFDFKL